MGDRVARASPSESRASACGSMADVSAASSEEPTHVGEWCPVRIEKKSNNPANTNKAITFVGLVHNSVSDELLNSSKNEPSQTRICERSKELWSLPMHQAHPTGPAVAL